MRYCFNCGNHFKELEKTQEYMGECHGFPAYETNYVCPICKSEDWVDDLGYRFEDDWDYPTDYDEE